LEVHLWDEFIQEIRGLLILALWDSFFSMIGHKNQFPNSLKNYWVCLYLSSNNGQTK
jgi:predicted transcriptional regulator